MPAQHCLGHGIHLIIVGAVRELVDASCGLCPEAEIFVPTMRLFPMVGMAHQKRFLRLDDFQCATANENQAPNPLLYDPNDSRPDNLFVPKNKFEWH